MFLIPGKLIALLPNTTRFPKAARPTTTWRNY